MRIRAVLLFIVFCVVALPDAAAQFWRPAFFVSGGLAAPVSPERFADARGAGLSAGAGVGLALSRHVLVQVAGDYSYMPVSDTAAGADAAQVLTATGNIVLAPTGHRFAIRPYVITGAGYYRITGGGEAGEEGDGAEATYGLVLGAGLDFIVGEGVGVFLESRYVLGFTDPEQTGHVPVRLGIAFQ